MEAQPIMAALSIEDRGVVCLKSLEKKRYINVTDLYSILGAGKQVGCLDLETFS